MGIVFDGTGYLKSTITPVTTIPWTVGFWVWLPSLSSNELVGLCAAASTNVRYSTLYSSGAGYTSRSTSGGTNASSVVPNAVAGTWTYMLSRYITTTNRRVDTIEMGASGRQNDQDTASLSVAACDTILIGSVLSANSPVLTALNNTIIAEYSLFNADIGPGGAMDTAFMQQLALKGPFSIPYLADKLIDYRSFQRNTDDRVDHGIGHKYQVGKLQTNYVMTGSTGLRPGPHPPLASDYVRPTGQRKRLLMV